jgi:hypothetical protein
LIVILTTFESALKPSNSGATASKEQVPFVFFATIFPLDTVQILAVFEVQTSAEPCTVTLGSAKLFATLSFLAKDAMV